jgi:hypothetical protein
MTADTPCRALRPVNPFKVAALALLMHDGFQSAKLLVFKLLIMAIIAVKGFAARLGYYLLVRKRLIF